MAGRTQNAKRRPKRRTYRRKRKYGGSMLGQSLRAPLGKSFKGLVRYVDKNVQLNPGVGGVPVNHVFSMNGLYDPDITSTGHSVSFFTQMMQLYDHYTVIGSRARVSFSNTDTSYQQLVALQLKDTNTTDTVTNEILEQGGVIWRTLGAHGSGQAVKDLVIKCSPSKFFGRNVMSGDKYQGTSTSNPSDQVFLHIHAGPLEAADTDIIDATVEIEYIVVFTEPKQIPLA